MWLPKQGATLLDFNTGEWGHEPKDVGNAVLKAGKKVRKQDSPPDPDEGARPLDILISTWTFDFSKCNKINVCCMKHQFCTNLLW